MKFLSRPERRTIRRLAVRPGDVVVITSPPYLSNAQRRGLTEHVESLLPDGAHCLVLDGELDIHAVLAAEVMA